MKLPKSLGFTLVELLIVMAIIAILAVGVLVGLNPIEQINKAKDNNNAQMAGQLLDAIQRYNAQYDKYPWGLSSASDVNVYHYDHPNAGVSTALAAADGVLITTGELKTAFRTNALAGHLFAGSYTAGAGFSACYVPTSKGAKGGFTAAGSKFNSFDYKYMTGCAVVAGVGFRCTALTTPVFGTNCGLADAAWTYGGANQCVLCATSL